jgi:4-hydroxybenzoate polyprenyltransferase
MTNSDLMQYLNQVSFGGVLGLNLLSIFESVNIGINYFTLIIILALVFIISWLYGRLAKRYPNPDDTFTVMILGLGIFFAIYSATPFTIQNLSTTTNVGCFFFKMLVIGIAAILLTIAYLKAAEYLVGYDKKLKKKREDREMKIRKLAKENMAYAATLTK